MKRRIVGLTFVMAFVMVFSTIAQAGVMMQGFYWDCPAGGNWWGVLQSKASELKNMVGGYGINRIWFPPASKGESGQYSMGYDPYDYYDLGQYNQKGTTETRFGSQAELKAAIAAYKVLGVSVIADIVLNHRAGGAGEANGKTGATTYTNFTGVLSGKNKWTWTSFHPNNGCASDQGFFSSYPDVCYSTTSGSSAYNDTKTWLTWLKNSSNAGFDGWRYDFVRGFDPSVVKDMNKSSTPTFSVGENWDQSTTVIRDWVNASDTNAFDFPLYYTIRDICNNTSGGGNMANLFSSALSFTEMNSSKSVTFVANHDTDEITSPDKMMGYAFILTYKGYPCIFWKDYFDWKLSTGGNGSSWGNGIKQLVWCREKLAGGSPNIEVLKKNDADVAVYGSKGSSTSAPGYLVIINDNASAWKAATVTTANTYLKGKTLKTYAYSSSVSGQNYQPGNQACSSTGSVTLYAPPRGYAVYSVDGL